MTYISHKEFEKQPINSEDWLSPFAKVKKIGKNEYKVRIHANNQVFEDSDGSKIYNKKTVDSVNGYTEFKNANALYRYYNNGVIKIYSVLTGDLIVTSDEWFVQYKVGENWVTLAFPNKTFSSTDSVDSLKFNLSSSLTGGSINIDHLLKNGRGMKHNIEFKNTNISASPIIVRVIRQWTLNSGVSTEIKDYTIKLTGSGKSFLIENLCTEFKNGKLKDISIVDNILTMVFGDYSLSTNSSLNIDPYDFSNNDPTEDGYISYLTFGGYTRLDEDVDLEVGGSTSPFVASYRSYVEWDITSIPDTATITDTDFEYDGTGCNAGTCRIGGISTQPTVASDSVLHGQISTGTAYVASFSPVAATDQVIDLTSTADGELQTALSSRNWWAIGIKATSETAFKIFGESEDDATPDPAPTLSVSYTAGTAAAECDSSGRIAMDSSNNYSNEVYIDTTNRDEYTKDETRIKTICS